MDTAAANVASYLTAYNASIMITITGESDYFSSTLAYAGTNYNIDAITPGFFNFGAVGRKILSNGADDENGGLSDGYIHGNMGDWYSYSASVSGEQWDFTSIAMHEIGHAIGFVSAGLQADGSTILPNAYSPMERYFVNSAGVSLYTESSPGIFDVNLSIWNAASTGGPGNGVFFNGPNAMAANGGNLVPMYSPVTWEDGSSMSHLYNMDPDLTAMMPQFSPGLHPREFSPIEIGIFRDIGYTQFGVPEPGSAMLALCALGSLTLRRKRRAA